MGNTNELRQIQLSPEAIRLSGDKIFYTLQGEGKTMGEPAVFCRLHVCNLTCDWCDAWYTWKKDTEEFWTESELQGFEKTALQIKEAWRGKGKPRVVFTGGEPLIQRKQIDRVRQHLAGWATEIETNGTITPTDNQLKTCQFNCSPKLSNSGVDRDKRRKPLIIRKLNEVDTNFKFVIQTLADINEMEEDYLPLINPEKVILMPEGTDTETLLKRQELLAKYAMDKGFRLMGRLQVELFGNKRGV